MKHHLLLISITLLLSLVLGDFSNYGCFPEDSVSGSLEKSDEYIYQSNGHCKQQCSGSKYAALIDGSTCYCGDTYIDKSESVDDSNCDTSCQGYTYEKCGGSNYFLILADSSVEVSTSSSSTSSSTSTSSSSTSLSEEPSTSSSSSSSTSLSEEPSTSSSSSSTASLSEEPSTSSSSSSTTSLSSSDSSSSAPRVVTTITEDSEPVPTTLTRTADNSASTSDSDTTSSETDSNGNNNDNVNDNNNDDDDGLSGGAIAGVVVGSVAGVGLLALLAFLFILYRRRRGNDEDDDDDETYTNNEKYPDPAFIAKNSIKSNHHKQYPSLGQTSNSFSSTPEDNHMFENPNFNPPPPPPSNEWGRRRLSDGSLPDMVTKGSLKVVNN